MKFYYFIYEQKINTKLDDCSGVSAEFSKIPGIKFGCVGIITDGFFTMIEYK